MRTEKVDVLVIGAGPAGSVAAAILNKNGHQVKVVEKQQFPRFVIGESLLPLCLDNFEMAGLLDAVKQQGYQVKNGASFLRKKNEFCDFDFSEQHSAGYPHAWQMPRASLDKTLIDEVARQGVDVNFQHSVEDVAFDEEKATINLVDDKGSPYTVEAKFVVDASGYGRVLPRLLDLNKASDFPARTAFFAHLKDNNRPEGASILTEIIDFDRGDASWTWIIPFEEGVTSVGFVGETSFFNQFQEKNDKDKFKAILNTHYRLKERFGNPEFVFEPKIISGYSIGVKQMYGDRFILVGNSTEFLDPIFSSGVAFASESGARAAELVSKHLHGESVDFEDYVTHMQQGINVFRTYVKEWYNGNLQTVFFAADKTPAVKRQICSVLAGYVWDQSNPYVRKHKKAISVLAEVIKMQKKSKAEMK